MPKYAAAVVLALLAWPVLAVHSRAPHRAITAAQPKAIVQAIEDEIYDWGCQAYEYEFVGEKIGYETYKVSLYIKPTLDNGTGEVIYKLMPFGEVRRAYSVGASGTIYLDGSPRTGFGPMNSSCKTLYLDDEKICRDKRVDKNVFRDPVSSGGAEAS